MDILFFIEILVKCYQMVQYICIVINIGGRVELDLVRIFVNCMGFFEYNYFNEIK